MIRSYSTDSVRDKNNALYRKPGCMAVIFTSSKSSIGSLSKEWGN
jgi:hypothetical protein